MGKLRYDLAADAILSLQNYIDTCADDRNTMALLDNAEKAVIDLRKIESRVYQKRSPGKPANTDIVAAFTEMQRKADAAKERLAPIKDFLLEFRAEIMQVQLIAQQTLAMAAILSKMKDIERQIEGVRRKVTIL